jgi:glycosyltransferase involved in cell wall biosynthesis
MKILFIAGSLEPGRDGVGDYTRTLAAKCQRLGQESFLVGLNDPWVETSIRENRSFRFSAKSSWLERVNQTRAFVEEVEPDIISLQFVPYSYHPAGLNFTLPRLLRTMVGRVPVQIMFHELWIGANVGASAKARIVGFAQRKVIEKLVLAAHVVHTSNEVYRQLLVRHGVSARLLPMFGSIPIVDERLISPDGLGENSGAVALRLALFGAIHPEWSADGLLTRLQRLGRPIRFFHVGRIGSGDAIWNDLTKRYGSQFCRYGEQPPEEVSRLLLSADLGVATTPLSLIPKSSSVAAILEHGLPVIVTRDDIHFRGVQTAIEWADRLIPLDEMFFERMKTMRKQPPRSRLSEITAQFLADIGA